VGSRRKGAAVVILAVGLATGVTAVAEASMRATPIVLGTRAGFPPGAKGWGTAHPSLIDNDGDPSGHAWHIRWTGWGTTLAKGVGLTYVLGQAYGSGYRTGRLELRASRIGHCLTAGPRAYTRLEVRVAPLKHGSFSAWQLWNGRPNVCHSTH